ncbi:MAG: hypothetical protein ACJAYU_000294 [Bradymonadia bacterium]|jgi:hypothetical protein
MLCIFASVGCSRGGGDEDVSEGTGDSFPTPLVAAEGDPLEAETPTPAGDPVAPIEVAPNRDRRPEVEANRNLAQRLGLAPPDPLLVSDLLTRADVRELTNFQGELLETSLAGIAPAPGYNTIRLRADGGYGFALQVWQTDELRQVAAHFRRLRETYFDSALDSSGVGNEAFTADFQGIRHYAFLHRQSKSAAVITCDRTLCDAIQIRAMAQRVGNRL